MVKYAAKDWIKKAKEICHANYMNLTHPHLCQKCGSSKHERVDCPKPKDELKCLYPFCCPSNGSKQHMTKICPTVIAACQSCGLNGHHATHHGSTEFDVFVAYNTQKLFSFVHVIGSLMNHQDMVFASNQSGFHPFLPSLKRLWSRSASIEEVVTFYKNYSTIFSVALSICHCFIAIIITFVS